MATPHNICAIPREDGFPACARAAATQADLQKYIQRKHDTQKCEFQTRYSPCLAPWFPGQYFPDKPISERWACVDRGLFRMNSAPVDESLVPFCKVYNRKNTSLQCDSDKCCSVTHSVFNNITKQKRQMSSDTCCSFP
jgi:hypothetical protein